RRPAAAAVRRPVDRPTRQSGSPQSACCSRSGVLPVLTEYDVGADDVRIGTVNARRVHHVGGPEASRIPDADKRIGDEPPHVTKQVRTRQPRNATYGDPIEVHAVGPHGVQTQVEALLPPLYLLGQAALRAAPTVELRRDDPDL